MHKTRAHTISGVWYELHGLIEPYTSYHQSFDIEYEDSYEYRRNNPRYKQPELTRTTDAPHELPHELPVTVMGTSPELQFLLIL